MFDWHTGYDHKTDRFVMRVTFGLVLAACVFVGLAVVLAHTLFTLAGGVG